MHGREENELRRKDRKKSDVDVFYNERKKKERRVCYDMRDSSFFIGIFY